MISSAMVPRPTEGIVFRTLGDETVVLNVDQGHYYVLNQTATAIWALCNGAHSLEAIAEHVSDEFDVSPGQAEESLSRLMGDLVQAGLVVLEAPCEGA